MTNPLSKTERIRMADDRTANLLDLWNSSYLGASERREEAELKAEIELLMDFARPVRWDDQLQRVVQL